MKQKKQKDFYNEPKIVKGFTEYHESKHSTKNQGIIKSLKQNKNVLSLGCGSGREVSLLVKSKHNVVAIDIAEEMVSQSKKIEPKAKYFCEDAIVFAEKNKDKIKFYYILGLFSFFNYISKKDRRKLIDNLIGMLEEEGILIFELRRVTDRWQDIIKTLLAPLYSLIYKLEYEEFGDVYSFRGGLWSRSHHYTKRQLKRLFRGYSYKIKDSEVIVLKNS